MRYTIPDLPEGVWRDTELAIERSRFITWTAVTPSTKAFDDLLAEARRTHPSASHHCSAFIAGPPGEQNAIGFSDDGEPGGTAGRPMFQVLEGANIGHVGCVVIRYFGGIKLGTGGLARAYAQAVSEALNDLPRREVIERSAVNIKVEFAGEAEARAWCQEHEIPVERADYQADGVTLRVGWPSDIECNLEPLKARLKGRMTQLDTS